MYTLCTYFKLWSNQVIGNKIQNQALGADTVPNAVVIDANPECFSHEFLPLEMLLAKSNEVR